MKSLPKKRVLHHTELMSKVFACFHVAVCIAIYTRLEMMLMSERKRSA